MAGFNLGDVFVTIKAKTEQLNSALSSASKTIESFSSKTTSALSGPSKAMAGFGNSIFGVAKKGALAFGALGAAAGGFALKSASDAQMLRASFDTLTGSAEKGSEVYSKLNKMAAATPFETSDLAKATQTMLSFGLNTDQSLKSLQYLGDISMGNSDKLQGLSLAFSQVQSTGRLMGQDLLQMINNGFNPLQQISKSTGRSMKDLKADMEKGKISADDIAQAFEDATKKGGQFFGGMDKGSKTLQGKISTLKDNLGMVARKLVGLSETGDVIPGGIFDKVSQAVQTLLDWIDKNKDAIIAFGEQAMKTAIEWGGKFIDMIKQVVQWMQQHETIVKAVAIALGIFVAVALIAAGIAAIVAGGWVLAFGLIATAIGFLVGWFIENWDKIKAKAIEVWNNIKNAFFAAVQFVVDKLTWLKNNWTMVIGYMIGFILTLPIKMGIAIYNGIKAIINAVKNVNWGAVWDFIKNAFTKMVDSLKNAMSGLWNWLKGLDWGGIIKGAISGIANAIIGLLEGVINGAISGLHLGPIHIPRLALGTPNFGGGLAMMGENGRELAMLPQGSKVLSNEKTEAVLSGGGSGGNTYHINLTGVLARSRNELADIGLDIIKAVDQRLMAKGKPKIMGAQ